MYFPTLSTPLNKKKINHNTNIAFLVQLDSQQSCTVSLSLLHAHTDTTWLTPSLSQYKYSNYNKLIE